MLALCHAPVALLAAKAKTDGGQTSPRRCALVCSMFKDLEALNGMIAKFGDFDIEGKKLFLVRPAAQPRVPC